jgi:hypothetical protein
MGYADGTWNEWHALFDNGRSGWLSEDNGAYVFAFDAPLPARRAPTPTVLQCRPAALADGRAWDVASVVRAKVLAAQGELPSPPRLGASSRRRPAQRAGRGGHAGRQPTPHPHWSVGRSVLLSELALTGLRDTAEKTLRPGASTCPQLRHGAGGEAGHHAVLSCHAVRGGGGCLRRASAGPT